MILKKNVVATRSLIVYLGSKKTRRTVCFVVAVIKHLTKSS